jgi:hypothetical protein
MRIRHNVRALTALMVAFLIFLSIGIEAFNNGHTQNDNIEWDCGGSCHSDPSTSVLTIEASKTTVTPGELIDIYTNVTGAEASATPLGIMIVRSQTITNSQPSVDGWVIINDPSMSGSFNYYEAPSVTAAVSWVWQFQAPVTPGSYNLYAHQHHGNGGRFDVDSNQLGTRSSSGRAVRSGNNADNRLGGIRRQCVALRWEHCESHIRRDPYWRDANCEPASGRSWNILLGHFWCGTRSLLCQWFSI